MADTYVSKAFTSAGTQYFIAQPPVATYDETGFTALTWTLVEEVTDLGTYGKVFTKVSHNPLGDRKTVKRKGSYDNGTLSLKMARVPSDAGQAILIAALDSDASYPMKVVLQDGTINYFTGQVLSYTTNVGTVNQITAAEVSVEVDNSVIEVAPVVAP